MRGFVTRNAPRRAQVLQAAVEVAAAGGIRGLTHYAVDRAAGVPQGTTVNHFRTRRELLRGTVEYVAGRNYDEALRRVPDRESEPLEVLVERFCVRMRAAAGDWKIGALARYRLALDGSTNPAVREPITVAKQRNVEECTALLKAAGSPDPARHGELVVALFSGLLLRQFFAPTADFDAERVVRSLLGELLAGHAGRKQE